MAKERDKGAKRAYEVGYRRPPQAHQFQPGKSGNPRGKPKGAPTFEEVLAREARRYVKLRNGDQVVNVTKLEALVRRLFAMALEGDLGAARIVLQSASLAGGSTDQQNPELTSMPDDEAVRRMLARFAHLLPNEDKNE